MSAKEDADWTVRDFELWMKRHGFGTVDAASALGISSRMVLYYLSERTKVSVMLKLACLAIDHGLDE